MKSNQIYCGDNLEVVKSWPNNCIDSICADPPYGLGLMGKEWDTFNPNTVQRLVDSSIGTGEIGERGRNDTSPAWNSARYDHSTKGHIEFQQWFTIWAKAMLRITKPGGILLCFGGTRTFHRLTCAIEDAGWDIRDCMMWLYGSGFPKSHNIGKAIDKFRGNQRKIIGKQKVPGYAKTEVAMGKQNRNIYEFPKSEGQSEWEGYGTALKPAWEPIIVAMKPLDGTFAANAEKHGVAGLWIDGGRIGMEKRFNQGAGNKAGGNSLNMSKVGMPEFGGKECQGRWPANLILDEEAGKMLDEQSGISKSTGGKTKSKLGGDRVYGKYAGTKLGQNAGGASRFFYCAKASRKERNLGLEGLSGKKVNDGRKTSIDNPYQRGDTIRTNTHPTVKPLALMKYLCTLLKMPSAKQIILDPFMGSGTTGMACVELGINFIGIEKEQEYWEIAVKRIAAKGKTLPVISHAETPKAVERFVDNKSQENTVQTATSSPNENPPRNDEHRQRLINAAAAALWGKRNPK